MAKDNDAPPAEPTRRSTRGNPSGMPTPAPVKEKKQRKRKAEEESSGEDGKTKKTKADGPTIDIGGSLSVLGDLKLQSEKDEPLDISKLADEKGLVIFLVPKADTPGCTNQACGFRDIFPDFTKEGFDVYCLSADKPSAQLKWQTKKSLPYPLISDPERIFISALGAGDGGKTKRSHFVFEKGGKLVEKKMPVKPVDSPKLALEFVQGLKAKAESS